MAEYWYRPQILHIGRALVGKDNSGIFQPMPYCHVCEGLKRHNIYFILKITLVWSLVTRTVVASYVLSVVRGE